MIQFCAEDEIPKVTPPNPFEAAGAVLQQDSLGDYYEIDGMKWFTCGSSPSLYRRSESGSSLNVNHIRGRWHWNVSYKIGRDAVWISLHGESPSLSEACSKANADLRAPVMVYEYLGQEFHWHQVSENLWIAAIDGSDEARIHRPQADDNFYWRRDWLEGARVLSFTSPGGCGQLQGLDQTLEAAIQACIDAPEFFRRACAALIASHRFL